MPKQQKTPVLRVDGPVVLDWGNGFRLQISPAGAVSAISAPAKARKTGRAGRKPSPATQAVIDAMMADKAAGRERTRQEYLQVLRGAGHQGSDQSAGLILTREAKRVFGHTLGRGTKAAKPAKKSAKRTAKKSAKKSAKKTARKRAGGGRPLSLETQLLRDKLQADSKQSQLGDATHYAKWLVKQPKTKMGLKPAKTLIYREMRRLNQA